jgi:hypothetical protein
MRDKLFKGCSHSLHWSGKTKLKTASEKVLVPDSSAYGQGRVLDLVGRVVRLGKAHPHYMKSIYHTRKVEISQPKLLKNVLN